MEITTDVSLKGTAWNKAIEGLASIFSTRTNYSLFMLSLVIGIMYDKRIKDPEEHGEQARSVPRNVLTNQDNGKLDFYFQAVILSTSTEELTEDERLDLAFGEKTDFNKLAFMIQFANFGVTKLVEQIGSTTLETMDNIKNFLVTTVEGKNLEINELPIDDLINLDEL